MSENTVPENAVSENTGPENTVSATKSSAQKRPSARASAQQPAGFANRNHRRPPGLALVALGVSVAVGLSIALLAGAAPSTPVKSKSTAGGSNTVAEVGGQLLSMADLEASMSNELAEVDRQRQRLLERGLDRLVEERLLALEAERREQSVQDYLDQELEAKVAEVSDAEVDAWYEANQARVRRPKEQVAGQIAQMLRQQGLMERRQELVGELRSRYGVRMLMEPLRLDLETEGYPAKGPEAAPVTVVEFSDFQCPACRRVLPELQKVRDSYGDKVRLVFRQFPLRDIHPQAQGAAEASLCAHEQGKFWQMHDAMFADPSRLASEDLTGRAEELGLDLDSFKSCMESGRHRQAVQADIDEGRKAGVGGTPWIFVNGRPVDLGNEAPSTAISRLVDDELARAGRS